ncbi:MAG: WG repeat-containing protein [Sphingobacteriales bacterium]|nr:WG repeat-containing protein [Sphingobacteriales bacterium]MBL0246331.1 WG repeat-containing protein [Sphingobacteriales bacterium]MDA0198334.1 WG repeat-containing protein [Bacteroidota bacterium]
MLFLVFLSGFLAMPLFAQARIMEQKPAANFERRLPTGDIVSVLQYKYGLKDAQANLIIPHEYDYLWSASETVYVAAKKNTYILFDANGKLISKLKYDFKWDTEHKTDRYNWVFDANEQVARVKKMGRWGLIKITNGQVVEVFPCQADTILSPLSSPSSNGDLFYYNGLCLVKQNGKWGCANAQGQLVIPAQYTAISARYDGIILAQKTPVQWVIINAQNREVQTIAAKKITINNPIESATKGKLFAFENINGKWGFINTKGEVVLPANFDKIDAFAEGLAPASQSGKYGYLNAQFQMAIASQFDFAYPFNEGLAVVGNKNSWGFIDKTGKIVIPLKYDQVRRFNEGRSWAKRAEKWYIINKQGREIKGFNFKQVQDFENGLAYVVTRDPHTNLRRIGLVDTEGEEVLAPYYDEVFPKNFVNGFGIAHLENRMGIISKSGLITPVKYIDIQFVEHPVFIATAIYTDKTSSKLMYCLINRQGHESNQQIVVD